MANIWTNKDGLKVAFGKDQAPKQLVGEFHNDGPLHCAAITFDYTDMPAVASNSVVIDATDNFVLPKGSIVEKVEIFCDVDIDSTSDDLTLNVGWVDLDGTSNADVDAFVVAATQTELNTGGTNVSGWVGAEVGGNKTTAPKLLTWEVDNHAATAGSGTIRLYYSAH
jgi:hypothetical protein